MESDYEGSGLSDGFIVLVLLWLLAWAAHSLNAERKSDAPDKPKTIGLIAACLFLIGGIWSSVVSAAREFQESDEAGYTPHSWSAWFDDSFVAFLGVMLVGGIMLRLLMFATKEIEHPVGKYGLLILSAIGLGNMVRIGWNALLTMPV